MQAHNTSPLDASKRMGIAELAPLRTIKESIEEMVTVGSLDAELLGAWKNRKR